MIEIPKGTADVLPGQIYKWHYAESKIRQLAKDFGFTEIRTPTFEHTELFSRGVGETTDIVNKEMYTFTDKGGRSMSLKPEGTAGVVRSYIENGLDNLPKPVKLYYITPVFRYEKPQKGRLREHHQFGVELLGSGGFAADAEVISLAKTLFTRLGINDLELNINNIGCNECRKTYTTALKAYFAAQIDQMCPVCKNRLDKNPLRILDCKETDCINVSQNSPVVTDYLCGECLSHHEGLKDMLNALEIPFKVNPRIVRGLDYYTGTVFEFISTAIGSQGTVCGGGRYNNLVNEIGGKSCPAAGFGMGIERLLMVMENAGADFGETPKGHVYFVSIGEKSLTACAQMVYKLRKKGVNADFDLMSRSVNAQMKYANKAGYNYVIVVGENELATDTAVLKNMLLRNEREIFLSEIENFF